MRALRFKLSGKTAHFKKPDVNSYAYFTYSHITKIHLMGMIGAVIGLEGYAQQRKDQQYPEFYQKLKDIRFSIIPPSENRGFFSKKIQYFNNSIGYASQEEGGNLIIKEQWLEDVSWDILIDLENGIDFEIAQKIEDYIINSKAEFIPYLGKNDHIADIEGGEILELIEEEDPQKIDSLFYLNKIELDDDAQDDDEMPFLFKEFMPIKLNDHNMYEFEKLAFTNRLIEGFEDTIYSWNQKCISFI